MSNQTIGPTGEPVFPGDVANKAYVDRVEKLRHFQAWSLPSTGASWRSLNANPSGSYCAGTTGGVPANQDWIALETITIQSLEWFWRAQQTSGYGPFFSIYNTDTSTAILTAPTGVRDEVHQYEPPNPVTIEKGKAYSYQLQNPVNFLDNNVVRFGAKFYLV